MSEDWQNDPFVDPDDPAAIERAERRREREAKRSKRDNKKREKEAAKAPPPPAPEPPKPQRTPEQEFWNEDPETPPTPPSQAKGAEGKPEKPAASGSPRDSKGAEPAAEAKSAGDAPTEAASQAETGERDEKPGADTPRSADEAPKGGADAPAAPVLPPEPVPGAPRTGEGKLPPPLPFEDPTVEAPKSGKRFRRRKRTAAAGAAGGGAAGAAAAAASEDPAEGAGAAGGAPKKDDASVAPPPSPEEPTPNDPESGEQPLPEGPNTSEQPLPGDPNTGEHPLTGEHPATGEYAPLTSQHELPSEEWDAKPAREEIWDDEGDPELASASRGRGGRGGGRRGREAAAGGGFWAALKRHPFRAAGLVLLFIVLWFVYALFQPFHSGGHGKVQVKIPRGASVSEVGDLLLDKDVIQSPIFPVSGSTMFQIRAQIDGKSSSLYPGPFTLEEGMSYGDALDALSVPPVKRVTTVTVPEGYTRSQAGQIVKEVGVPGNYVKKTVKSKYLDPADYGGKGAKNLEGFLFPNTFELKPKAPVADLVELQLKDFKRQIKKVDMKYANSKNLTVYDVLIIASMIEREAGVPKQRKQVAAVVYNRLKEGMPLGIDATIRFAVDNYDKPLTESELATDSPYNTRTNSGLPPGPINSPGLAAINAAAHPAKSDYIFYVNKPNTCGELSFSENETEFEEDVAAYEKAREANGGNEPSSC